MNMACMQSTAVNLFDQYRLLIRPKLKSHQDGPPGQRVLFITDKKESFTVSFEEGATPMDMFPEKESEQTVRFQCCRDGKYIYLRRRSEKPIPCAFFHIELEDEDGKQHCLAGQIVVDKGYQWTDGVEPILMELLEGIAVCKTKGGGSD